MSPLFRRLFCTALLGVAGAAAAPARAANYTDIWFVPAESGWGVNVVQSDNFMFLTFFIYGADGKPTWYAGNLSWNGNVYTGGLFLTQGTYFAAPWNPGAYGAQQVGTATFQPSTQSDQAILSYTVNGVGTVTKSIERQTLTTIALGGSYAGGQAGSLANCANPSDDETYFDKYSLSVTQAADNTATFTFTYDSGNTCTISGMLEPHGQLYRMTNATYQCSGQSLNYSVLATVDEVRAASQGVEGQFHATIPGACLESARFSAVGLF